MRMQDYVFYCKMGRDSFQSCILLLSSSFPLDKHGDAPATHNCLYIILQETVSLRFLSIINLWCHITDKSDLLQVTVWWKTHSLQQWWAISPMWKLKWVDDSPFKNIHCPVKHKHATYNIHIMRSSTAIRLCVSTPYDQAPLFPCHQKKWCWLWRANCYRISLWFNIQRIETENSLSSLSFYAWPKRETSGWGNSYLEVNAQKMRISVIHMLLLIMMMSSNGNIFRVTGLLWGEFTGHRWIPRTKASDAELWCFLWSLPE